MRDTFAPMQNALGNLGQSYKYRAAQDRQNMLDAERREQQDFQNQLATKQDTRATESHKSNLSTAASQEEKAQVKHTAEKMGMIAEIMSVVDAAPEPEKGQAYKYAVSEVAKVDPKAAAAMPPEFDPAKYNPGRAQFLKTKAAVDAKWAAIKKEADYKHGQAIDLKQTPSGDAGANSAQKRQDRAVDMVPKIKKAIADFDKADTVTQAIIAADPKLGLTLGARVDESTRKDVIQSMNKQLRQYEKDLPKDWGTKEMTFNPDTGKLE